MTSWNPQIPNPLNVPSNDAVSTQQNFGVLDAAFQVDHIPLSQSTDQGKHGKITFSQPPTILPFVPNAQNSFAYERMLTGAATKSFLEYQSAGAGPNNIIPFSFKAWGIARITGANAGVLDASFNLTLVSVTTSAANANFQFSFVENPPSTNYMIFALPMRVALTDMSAMSHNASISGFFLKSSAAVTVGDRFSIGVM